MRSLLMGGQACVLYGGAEFSRDTDLVIMSDVANLARLRTAVADLAAHPIAVPPFEKRFLDEGLAIHFRCRATGVEGMRLDVMSRVRGLRELRTPEFLIRVAREAPASCLRMVETRPLLTAAMAGDEAALARLLRAEEEREREADRQYWAPLRRQLEALRREHHARS